MFFLWYGRRQEKGAQIYCFTGKVSQDTSTFYPRVGGESDKLIKFRSFKQLAHDNSRETRNQVQNRNVGKSPRGPRFHEITFCSLSYTNCQRVTIKRDYLSLSILPVCS